MHSACNGSWNRFHRSKRSQERSKRANDAVEYGERGRDAEQSDRPAPLFRLPLSGLELARRPRRECPLDKTGDEFGLRVSIPLPRRRIRSAVLRGKAALEI